jgi:hypothetical protein
MKEVPGPLPRLLFHGCEGENTAVDLEPVAGGEAVVGGPSPYLKQ